MAGPALVGPGQALWSSETAQPLLRSWTRSPNLELASPSVPMCIVGWPIPDVRAAYLPHEARLMGRARTAAVDDARGGVRLQENSSMFRLDWLKMAGATRGTPCR